MALVGVGNAALEGMDDAARWMRVSDAAFFTKRRHLELHARLRGQRWVHASVQLGDGRRRAHVRCSCNRVVLSLYMLVPVTGSAVLWMILYMMLSASASPTPRMGCTRMMPSYMYATSGPTL
eukprot:jgi/Tetstr1/431213/TSEL_020925.t1